MTKCFNRKTSAGNSSQNPILGPHAKFHQIMMGRFRDRHFVVPPSKLEKQHHRSAPGTLPKARKKIFRASPWHLENGSARAKDLWPWSRKACYRKPTDFCTQLGTIEMTLKRIEKRHIFKKLFLMNLFINFFAVKTCYRNLTDIFAVKRLRTRTKSNDPKIIQ